MMRGDCTLSEYTEHLRKKLITDINALGELKNQGKVHTLAYKELNERVHFAGIALKRRYELERVKKG